MIVRRFLAWAETAPAARRAQGASALARAFVQGPLLPDERQDALVALTSLLDDPSPLVRRAMAEALAAAPQAPRHVVAALAGDQSDIAAIVLAHSPLLSDAELIDHAAMGDVFAQSAIAIRPGLSAPVTAALAEVGAREALVALAGNFFADLTDSSMRRMLERCGEDGALREALLARPNRSIALHYDLVAATAKALTAFVTEKEWLSEPRAKRLDRESCDKAVVAMSAEAGCRARALVEHLRRSALLTPALVLRALLSGNFTFFEAALADLGRLPAAKVSGLVREFGGAGFAALYRKAELPAVMFPVVRAALAAARDLDLATAPQKGAHLSRALIERVIAASAGTDAHRLIALLRRFEAEAAREEAREIAFGIVRDLRFEQAWDLRPALFPPELSGVLEVGPAPVTADVGVPLRAAA